MRNGIKTISNPALNPTGLTAVGLARRDSPCACGGEMKPHPESPSCRATGTTPDS